MVTSLLCIAELDWPGPDFSTLCGRQKAPAAPIPHRRMGGPLNLLVHDQRSPAIDGADARGNGAAQRLQAVPGMGPVTAGALVSAPPDIRGLTPGRDLSAWIEPPPTPHATGARGGPRSGQQVSATPALSHCDRRSWPGTDRRDRRIRLSLMLCDRTQPDFEPRRATLSEATGRSSDRDFFQV